MAQAVASAMEEHKHLVVEAGTGTGKTMAYLIPAILSNKRVVVSTGTKNLQEQLFFKDIPMLETVFGRPLKVTYMKGRANYVCRQKVDEAARAETARGRTTRRWQCNMLPTRACPESSGLKPNPPHIHVLNRWNDQPLYGVASRWSDRRNQ